MRIAEHFVVPATETYFVFRCRCGTVGVEFASFFFWAAQVFISHLHSDHIADLATLYVTAMFGRVVPLEV